MDRSDRLREYSDGLGPQVAVIQMPGAGREPWTSPDGKTCVRFLGSEDIVVEQTIEVNGEVLGRAVSYFSAESAFLAIGALAEKAAILIAERGR